MSRPRRFPYNTTVTCADLFPEKRKGPPMRKMPDDFPERGPTMTLSDAERFWSAGQATVRRWHKENGSRPAPYDRGRRRKRKASPVPEGFAEIAPTLFLKQLMKRFKAGAQRIRRWCEEAGVKPRQVDRVELARARWANVPRRERKARTFTRAAPERSRVFRPTKSGLTATLPRDTSLEGQAADHLRRTAPVYRCNERGGADPHGKFWRYGVGLPMTPAELIERAERKGWDARAWERVG